MSMPNGVPRAVAPVLTNYDQSGDAGGAGGGSRSNAACEVDVEIEKEGEDRTGHKQQY